MNSILLSDHINIDRVDFHPWGLGGSWRKWQNTERRLQPSQHTPWAQEEVKALDSDLGETVVSGGLKRDLSSLPRN